MPRPGRGGLGKSKGTVRPTYARDWHASLGGLLLKAEKATDSLERMLAVSRLLSAFLVNLLRPGSRFTDTPSVILGQHYLSHRELGQFHRGDLTRVYLQELCSYDPIDGPVPSAKYNAPGHVDVARWNVSITPIAHVRTRKEGIIGSGLPYVEVTLSGSGSLHFPRHEEIYSFSLPSLILTTPLSDECPLDFDGMLSIDCRATGQHADLIFLPWKDSGPNVKGSITRLAGSGQVQVAKIEGRWDERILAYGIETESEGMLFDPGDYPPVLPLPAVICLGHPGPRMVPRFWSAVLEALLYVDAAEAEKAGKRKAAELAHALPEALRAALLFDVPEGPLRTTRPKYDDEESKMAARDPRPIPPASKIQRAMGRQLKYQLQHQVQSVTQTALEEEVAEMIRGSKAGAKSTTSAATAGTGMETSEDEEDVEFRDTSTARPAM